LVTMPPRTVFLIGFSGSGKSTIGPPLARKLKAEFFDTDAMIEKQTGRTISDLIMQKGETFFRTLEHKTIRRLLRSESSKVVALGGGAFVRRGVRELIDTKGIVVYLSCPVRELYRRLRLASDRPLLEGRPRVGETDKQAKLRRMSTLLNQRNSSYSKAHVRVSTANKSLTDCVQEVYRKVRELNARSSR